MEHAGGTPELTATLRKPPTGALADAGNAPGEQDQVFDGREALTDFGTRFLALMMPEGRAPDDHHTKTCRDVRADSRCLIEPGRLDHFADPAGFKRMGELSPR